MVFALSCFSVIYGDGFKCLFHKIFPYAVVGRVLHVKISGISTFSLSLMEDLGKTFGAFEQCRLKTLELQISFPQNWIEMLGLKFPKWRGQERMCVGWRTGLVLAERADITMSVSSFLSPRYLNSQEIPLLTKKWHVVSTGDLMGTKDRAVTFCCRIAKPSCAPWRETSRSCPVINDNS